MLTAIGHLMLRSWRAMTAATSTNTLGFILWTLGITFIAWATSVVAKWFELRRSGSTAPFRAAIRASSLNGIFLLLGVTLLVGSAWEYFTLLTIYNDHNYLVQQIQSIPGKDQKVRELTARLDEICFQPDRKLKQEQHDVLYRSLSELAKKSKDKRLALKYAACDLETAGFTSAIWQLLKNAGWEISEPTPFPMPKKIGDSQPPGGGSLSITIEMDESTPEGKERRQRALGILQAFDLAKVSMMQFPVGDHNPTHTNEVTVWVGSKPMN
jgi:hypothetical protein